jgi:hypothetical protein
LILGANILNKRTTSTRAITFRHLNALYGIEAMPPIAKALAALWKRDPGGRPLLDSGTEPPDPPQKPEARHRFRATIPTQRLR